jgi:hypothetical protein
MFLMLFITFINHIWIPFTIKINSVRCIFRFIT